MAARSTRLLRRMLLVALSAITVAIFGRALFYAYTVLPLIRWPFEQVPGEGTMLFESQLLHGGFLSGLRTLYGPQVADRFIAGNYPPVYLLLWALKPGAAAGYPLGRLLSLAAGGVTAVAGGVAVARALSGGPWVKTTAGILGGSLFIATVPVMQQLTIAKPDLVALAFAALALAAFEFRRERGGLVASGLLLGLALLTKQSLFFVAASLGIAALRGGRRDFVRFAAPLALAGIIAAGILLAVAGPSLFEHLVVYNRRGWGYERLLSLDAKFVKLHWPLLAASITYGLWGLRYRPRSPLTYFPLFALGTLVTIGIEGAYRNYYLELCLAMALGAAMALGTLAGSARAIALPGAILGVALVGTYAGILYTEITPAGYLANVQDPKQLERGDRFSKLLVRVDAAPDPVLSDEAGLLAMRGRVPVLDDPFLAKLMRDKGRWDASGVVAGLRARSYSVFVPSVTDGRPLRVQWGDAFVDALEANYDLGPDGVYTRRLP